MIHIIFVFFAVLTVLFAPGQVSAHAGIEPRQWPRHVLANPFGAWDHILAVAIVGVGLLILFHKQASRTARVAGAVAALAGLSLLLV